VCVCGRGESLSLPSGHEGSAQACLTNKDEQTHTWSFRSAVRDTCPERGRALCVHTVKSALEHAWPHGVCVHITWEHTHAHTRRVIESRYRLAVGLPCVVLLSRGENRKLMADCKNAAVEIGSSCASVNECHCWFTLFIGLTMCYTYYTFFFIGHQFGVLPVRICDFWSVSSYHKLCYRRQHQGCLPGFTVSLASAFYQSTPPQFSPLVSQNRLAVFQN